MLMFRTVGRCCRNCSDMYDEYQRPVERVTVRLGDDTLLDELFIHRVGNHEPYRTDVAVQHRLCQVLSWIYHPQSNASAVAAMRGQKLRLNAAFHKLVVQALFARCASVCLHVPLQTREHAWAGISETPW